MRIPPHADQPSNPAAVPGTKPGTPQPPTEPQRFSGVIDRRTGLDRRLVAKMQAELDAELNLEPTPAPASTPDQDSDAGTGLERRRGPGRRRTDFTKSAEEGEMTQEQFLFIAAIEAFKRSNAKMFPTWTDVLEVVRLLGYRKTMPSELNLRNVEDWTEKPATPSGVRTKPGHPELPRDQRRAA